MIVLVPQDHANDSGPVGAERHANANDAAKCKNTDLCDSIPKTPENPAAWESIYAGIHDLGSRVHTIYATKLQMPKSHPPESWLSPTSATGSPA